LTRGYLLAATGAALFSLNGVMARYLLDDGVGGLGAVATPRSGGRERPAAPM
jgi:hypothetical protein